MTTANLSVGINTKPAYESLAALKAEMAKMQKLVVQAEISGLKELKLAIDSKTLRGSVETALKEAFDHRYDVKINADALKAQIKSAVEEGAAGLKVGVGGVAGSSGAPMVQDLLTHVRMQLAPALEELGKAAASVGGTARKIGAGETTKGTAKASTSISVTDPETGYSIRYSRSLDNPDIVRAGIESDKRRQEQLKAAAQAEREQSRQLDEMLREMQRSSNETFRARRSYLKAEEDAAKAAAAFGPDRVTMINGRARMQIEQEREQTRALAESLREMQRSSNETFRARRNYMKAEEEAARAAASFGPQRKDYERNLAEQRARAFEEEVSAVRGRLAAMTQAARGSYTGAGARLAAVQGLMGEGVGRDVLGAAMGRGSQWMLSTSAADLAAYAKKVEEAEPKLKKLADNHTHLSDTMRDAHSSARGLAGALDMLWVTWGSTVPIVAGAALAATLRGVYEEGKRVEYQLAFVKGLSGESLSPQQFQNAMQGSMFGAKEGADALRALTQSGLSAREAIAALPDVLALATVGETSVTEAAFAATGVLKAFGLQMGDIGRVSDVMAKAAAVSNAGVNDMMAAFKYASASASLYGVSLEETGAALAALSEKNIKGSMAGTAHMNMLRELYTPTQAAAKAFKQLGIDVQAWQREGLSSIEMIDRLRETTSKLDSTSLRAFTQAIGGERGSRELAPLLEGGTSKLKDLRQQLEDSSGFTRQVMLELQNTVEGSSARISQALKFSLATAFDENKASIQAFNDALAGALRSEEFLQFVKQLATGLANLTRLFVDHADVIKTVAVAYISLRAASAVSNIFASMAVDVAALAAAYRAKLALMPQVVQQAGVMAGVVTTAEVAIARNTVATAAGTVAYTGFARAAQLAGGAVMFTSRALSFLAGPVGIAIGLVTTGISLWELFRGRQDDARLAQDAYTNSISNLNTALDQQIRLLRERNDAMRNPGKAPEQVTIEGQVKRVSDRIAMIEHAKKMFDQLGSKGPDSVGIPTLDGGVEKMNAYAVLVAYQSELPKLKADIEKLTPKIAALDAETKLNNQLNAAKSFTEWAESKKALLKDRGAAGKAISDAIDVYLNKPEVLTNTKQVESIRKLFETQIDKTATRSFTLPDRDAEGEAHRLALAELDKVRNKVRQDTLDMKETFRLNKELDESFYDSSAFGAYLKAVLAGNRQIAESHQAIFEAQLNVKRLEDAKKIGNLKDPDRARIDSDIENSNRDIDRLRMRLYYETQIAEARQRRAAQNDESAFDKVKTGLGGNYNKIITDIQQQTSRKVTDPVEQAGVTAELKVQEASREAIANQMQKVFSIERAMKDLREEDRDLTGDQLQSYLATYEATLKQLGVEKDRLEVLMQQADQARKVAGQVARDQAEKQQTAQYGWDKFWKEYAENATTNAKMVENLMKKTTDSMTDAFATFVTTGKLNFRGLVTTILAEAARMMAAKAMTQLFSLLGSMLFGPSVPSGDGSGATGDFARFDRIGSANGNVMTEYGPLALSKFEKGGITHRPMLSLVGEGTRPEAYVPLPDGRSIPVTMTGGTGGGQINIETNVYVNRDGSTKSSTNVDGKQGAELGQMIDDAVMMVIVREKRPGGILSEV